MTLYSVYDNRTDMPICVECTSFRAAELMRVTHESFLSAVSRRRKRNTVYHITVRNVSYGVWKAQRYFEEENKIK